MNYTRTELAAARQRIADTPGDFTIREDDLRLDPGLVELVRRGVRVPSAHTPGYCALSSGDTPANSDAEWQRITWMGSVSDRLSCNP